MRPDAGRDESDFREAVAVDHENAIGHHVGDIEHLAVRRSKDVLRRVRNVSPAGRHPCVSAYWLHRWRDRLAAIPIDCGDIGITHAHPIATGSGWR